MRLNVHQCAKAEIWCVPRCNF